MNIAKRIMDYGLHPPTIYFPLIVEEALMIEPTETESKESLDNFASVLKKIPDGSSRFISIIGMQVKAYSDGAEQAGALRRTPN